MEPYEHEGRYYGFNPQDGFSQTTRSRQGSWLADLGLVAQNPGEAHKRMIPYQDVPPYVQLQMQKNPGFAQMYAEYLKRKAR